MALSKEKLLKHFDEYISNEYYCMVDYELSSCPHVNKEESLAAMKDKINKLVDFRIKLEVFLNEK